MNIKRITFLLFILSILSVKSVTAQSWLDKAIKAIDKVDKKAQKIEKALTGGTEITAPETEVNDQSKYGFVQAFRNVETYTSDSQVPVKFVSCIRNGQNVTIEFEIGNNTDTNLEMYRFGVPKTLAGQEEITSMTDNLGINHIIRTATIGGKTCVFDAVMSKFEIYKGTVIKGSIMLRNVSSSATSFQAFKITFDNGMSGGYFVRYFTFKNVPILTMADIARLEQEYKQREFQRLVAKANKGDANAQYIVATTYYNNNDIAKAIDYYTRSADQGNAAAQGYLADLYLYGLGDFVTEDFNKALEYAQKSKDQGNELGYCTLGLLYAQGKGVDKNNEKAIEYLTFAANRENVNAQEWLGVLYTVKDPTLSAMWFKKAADNGGLMGNSKTGINYFSGRGIGSDKEKALVYFLKGVEKNDKECLYYAGRMYRRGEGCTQDLQKGHKCPNN